MSIRIALVSGVIGASMACHAFGEDRVSIRIYNTDSPVTREANDRTETALRNATDCAFDKRPLNKALDDLAQKHQINIWIDERTLQEEGISLDSPVTLKVSNIGLETVLRRILDPMGLTAIINDGGLMVSRVARADEIMHTRIYPVADLVKTDYGHLIKLIEESTSGKWMRIDQEGGTIQPYRKTPSLLIRQTDRCHREIAGALIALREAKSLQRTISELQMLPASTDATSAEQKPR